MKFDRTIYFDHVRASLFGGALTQQQVDGQEVILARWEHHRADQDLRHLAYALATTRHETASTMWPIEEYGKGAGMAYGKPDPETGQTYYGRGFVQLTWRDNYARATRELHLIGDYDLEWHADRALDTLVASGVMFTGMTEGWFRSSNGTPETFDRYFNETINDPYGAREIINGDKHIVPDWSNGVSIGNLIKDYHFKFFDALDAALIEGPAPEQASLVMDIQVSDSVHLEIRVNGELLMRG